MTTETHIGRALLRTIALLGITALSVVLALAAACGGEEKSQGEPTATPTQVTRTATPGRTPTVAKPTATVAVKPSATVAVKPTATAAAKPTATAAAKPTTVAQATPTPVVVQVSVDDAPGWGPEDASVTIVEFSDFL